MASAKRAVKAVAKKKSAKAGSTAEAKAARLAVLSNALSRAQLVGRLAGKQFQGNRDIYSVAGYVPQESVRFEHYWGLYSRGDVAGRIVDMPAKTTWRTPPMIVELDKEGEQIEDTQFVKEFNDLAKKLRLWHYFSRLDRVSGIGRYGCLFIGTSGTEDRQLKEPLESVAGGSKSIIYLGVYHEKHAEITAWETDVKNPRYGLPREYTLTTATDNTGTTRSFANAKLVVHASRVIHVAEDLIEDNVYGRSRLERPLNRLFDLDKVAASTGEAYWQSVSRILQAKVDPEAEIEDSDLDTLDEKLLELTHDLRRQFTGQGVELSWLGSETPDVSEVADFYFSLIAGASGIPKRILFGSEMGELASTTDQETYLGMINERQEQFAEPEILRQFIDRMVSIKALPAPQTGEYTVVWPTLFEATDKDKAEASLKRAQAAAALAGIGGNPLSLVTIDEDSNIWLAPQATPQPMLKPDELPDDDNGDDALFEDDDADLGGQPRTGGGKDGDGDGDGASGE